MLFVNVLTKEIQEEYVGKLYFYILVLITGLANGLFGSGGGIIAVPMLKKSGITTKESHATSLALTLPLSIVSCFFYIRNSDKILPDSLRLIPFGLAGAIIGGIIMKKIAPKYLKKAFGIILIISGLRLFIK